MSVATPVGDESYHAYPWKIQFLNHDGSTVKWARPENLNFELNLKEPHVVNWEISIGATGSSGTPIITRNFVGPYVNDFALWRGNKKIVQGILTMVAVQSEDDFVSFSGQSYTHYLERRMEPWPSTDDPDYADVANTCVINEVDKDVSVIVTALLEKFRDFPFSYSLDFTISAPTVGYTMTYTVFDGDTQTVFDHISTLSQQYNGGFDFEIDNNKVFQLYPKERGTPYIMAQQYDGPHNIISVGITNTGPQGTHIFASGAGTATRMNKNQHYRINSEQFRRLDMDADEGDVKSMQAVRDFAWGSLQYGQAPQHEIPLKPRVDSMPDFWNTHFPGCYVWVDKDLIFHHINSQQKVVGISCAVSNEGEEDVDLHLSQYYELNPNETGHDDP